MQKFSPAKFGRTFFSHTERNCNTKKIWIIQKPPMIFSDIILMGSLHITFENSLFKLLTHPIQFLLFPMPDNSFILYSNSDSTDEELSYRRCIFLLLPFFFIRFLDRRHRKMVDKAVCSLTLWCVYPDLMMMVPFYKERICFRYTALARDGTKKTRMKLWLIVAHSVR